MRVGFRNVDSQEMDGSPLFEVRPANPDVEAALLEDRVSITFELTRDGNIVVGKLRARRISSRSSPPTSFSALKTAAYDKYWLDTGVFDVERG